MWFIISEDDECTSTKVGQLDSPESEVLTKRQKLVLSAHTDVILRVISGDMQAAEDFGLLIDCINKDECNLHVKHFDAILISMLDLIIEKLLKCDKYTDNVSI